MSKKAMIYHFDERLSMSQGSSESRNIKDILLSNIPGALNAFPAHSENDRNGTDWWIETAYGKFLSVDCKVREEDWAAKSKKYDDLALETWSVVEKSIPGWTRDPKKQTDYILWIWMDTGRWCLIPFKMLCQTFMENWQRWKRKYKVSSQCTPRSNGNDYHSECVFVPRREVWASLYNRFSGIAE